MANYLFPVATFAASFAFFWLTWVAKHVWRDKAKTQAFAMVAIITALAFMYWALFVADIE